MATGSNDDERLPLIIDSSEVDEIVRRLGVALDRAMAAPTFS